MSVNVIIVHRDRGDVLASTVRAFHAQADVAHVTVVDNGSGPSSRDAAARLDGPVTVVDARANLGFGPAANIALRRWLRHGTGEWVAVAPHDAEPAPDVMARLLAGVGDRGDIGLVSADVGDGACPVIDPNLGAIQAPSRRAGGFEPTDFPHGTLLMARRSCLEQIGLFDERYFAYNEEADLGIRARRAGWMVGIVRDAKVHNPGISAGVERVAYLQHRNTLLMLRQHFGRGPSAVRLTIAVIQLAVGAVHTPARGLHWSPRGRGRAIVDHLLGRYGPPPETMRRRGGEYLPVA